MLYKGDFDGFSVFSWLHWILEETIQAKEKWEQTEFLLQLYVNFIVI